MNTEPLQARTSAALEWARAHNETDVHALNQTLLAFQFNQLLEALNLDKVKENDGKSSKDFLEIARASLKQYSERTKRMKIELEIEAHREEVAEKKRKMEQARKTPDLQKGLSPEVLQRIEEAMANL